ncbi:hypothetical protein [Pseudoxanthomonas suwonensis]
MPSPGNAGVIQLHQVLELEQAAQGLQRGARPDLLDEFPQVQLVPGQDIAGHSVVPAVQRLAQGSEVVEQGGEAGGGHYSAPDPA